MKRHFLITLLISTFFFVSTEIVSACSCPPPRIGVSEKELVESAKDNVDTIFVGRVAKIIKERDRHGVATGGYYAVFQVSESWKGPRSRILRVSTSCCMCDYPFSKGKNYLVYAYESVNTNKKILGTSICTRTKELNDPQVKTDQQYLGSPRTEAIK